MDVQTVYRHAMRCYRIAAKLPKTGTSGDSVGAFIAATSLVRSITGVWDVPKPLYRQQVCSGKRQRVTLWHGDFAVVPRFKHRDDGFGGPVETVIYRPGKLQVNRSMTLFCKRTNKESACQS